MPIATCEYNLLSQKRHQKSIFQYSLLTPIPGQPNSSPLMRVIIIEQSSQMSEETEQGLSQAYAGINFTSEFFGNFIDHSQIQENPSDCSQNHSIAESISDPPLDFSVSQEKQREFHMRNLLCISTVFVKKNAIKRWKAEKEAIKVLESRSPARVTKIFLKIFYSISVKLHGKYSLFFRQLRKIYQANPHPITSTPIIQKTIDKTEWKLKALAKIYSVLQKKLVRDCMGCLAYIDKPMQNIQILIEVVQNLKMNCLKIGWEGLREWLNYLDKFDILQSTIGLYLHRTIRQALWTLNNYKSSLYENDISHIEQANSRKHSLKMNNSTESIGIQKEMLQNIAHQQKNIIESDNLCNFRRPQGNEFIERNNPKHLKFSKDIKRKTTNNFSSFRQQGDQQNLQYQQSIMPNQPSMIPNESSVIKNQNQQYSLVRRASITMNTSYLSRSVIKKLPQPIEIPAMLGYRVITDLDDEDYTLELNDGRINKRFQNTSQVSKVRPLKHEQLRKQFTDFNDLFTIREIFSFFQSQIKQNKKAISLAKIKQKSLSKAHEEYGAKNSTITFQNDHKYSQRVLVSQPNIDYSEAEHIHRPSVEIFNSSIKISSSQYRERKLSKEKSTTSRQKMKGRTTELRIPSQLPKNYDYYVDRSIGRQKSPVEIGSELKRKSSSKSKKKLLFNIVKSGSSRNVGDGNGRKQGIKSTSLRPKLELNIKKASREKKEDQSGNCDYFMAFRSPPKKKMKKPIAS